MFLTLLAIGAVGYGAAVGVACLLHDGKDHTGEMSDYENTHPYSTWEQSQPYNP